MIKASAVAAPADRSINGGQMRMFRTAIGSSPVRFAPGGLRRPPFGTINYNSFKGLDVKLILAVGKVPDNRSRVLKPSCRRVEIVRPETTQGRFSKYLDTA